MSWDADRSPPEGEDRDHIERRQSADSESDRWARAVHIAGAKLLAGRPRDEIEAAIDIVIANITSGRTTSARELASQLEVNRVLLALGHIRDGAYGFGFVDGIATLTLGDRTITLDRDGGLELDGEAVTTPGPPVWAEAEHEARLRIAAAIAQLTAIDEKRWPLSADLLRAAAILLEQAGDHVREYERLRRAA